MIDPLPHHPLLADLTVALCTVGRPGYLEASLESLLDTTAPGPHLHVVLNDVPRAQRDAVMALAERWPGPTAVTELATRVPLVSSHNAAIDACTTSLITFMGDDDIVLAPRLHHLVAEFDREPRPAAVSSWAHRAGGPPREPRLRGHKDLGPTSADEWRDWVREGRLFELVFPAAVFDVAALRSVGRFEDGILALDTAMFTRLAQQAPVYAVPDRSFAYRIHGGSVTDRQWSELRQQVRFIRARLDAERSGAPALTWSEFVIADAARPRHRRLADHLRDRSMLEFRRGGMAMLERRRWASLVHMSRSVVLHPPTAIEKLRDQVGRRYGSE